MSSATKQLGTPEARAARLAAIEQGHVAPLTAYVRALRDTMGPEFAVPYFDPHDGGIRAECLFLLEAPGPKAVATGFVSRDNPDETAKNFYLLNEEAGIARQRTAIWNVVPWYVGSGSRIRPVNAQDVGMASPALSRLVHLLPALRSIVLVGAKSASAIDRIRTLTPNVVVFSAPHPSPMFVNRAPGNRKLLLDRLRAVSAHLTSMGCDAL